MRLIHAALWVVLVGCKSLAALIYSCILVPVTFFSSPRTQLRAARVLSCAVFFYPVLKILGLVPTETLLRWAESVDVRRANSLRFRFMNEEILLERARQKFLFGWGGYGRNRVFDPITGDDLSVTDGQWILTLGGQGIFGYVVIFGLLLLPTLAATKAGRNQHDRVGAQALATGAAILTAYSIDLIPNGMFQFFPFFLAGALYRASFPQGIRRSHWT